MSQPFSTVCTAEGMNLTSTASGRPQHSRSIRTRRALHVLKLPFSYSTYVFNQR